MANRDPLKEYILNQRAIGKSDEAIKRSLVDEGWEEEHFNYFFEGTKPPAYSTPEEKPNTLAIIGLALAVFLWPVGLIVSFVAYKKVKKSGEAGKGLAIAGIVISLLWLPATLFLIIPFTSIVYLGIVSPAELELNSCEFPGNIQCIGSPIIIASPEGGSFSVILRNDEGNSIDIQGVKIVEGSENDCELLKISTVKINDDPIVSVSSEPTVQATEVFTIKITCTGIIEPGSSFSQDVELFYSSLDTTIIQTTMGRIRGKAS